ncbi:MAG: MFS transporter [Campylobacteraceae bacterium]|nr:MFS transporter [Campylobacteraceae bacterium]
MRKLFKIKGFLPFIVVLSINASVDLGHKITIQNILVKSYSGDLLVALTATINLLILLPYVMLFSVSGFLNDKFSRTSISRVAAGSEILFTFLITIAYIKGYFIFAFAMTLLLAIQSAIYSPAKYALIKQIAKKENLGLANGVVEAATIVSILAASLIYSIIFEKFAVISDDPGAIMSSVWFIGVILMCSSTLETIFTFKLPYFKPADESSKFEVKEYLKFNYLKNNLKLLFREKNIWVCVLGVAVFWALAQLIIAVFPAHYKFISGDDNVIIIQLILASSTLGIVSGSFFAGYLSRKHIELGLAAPAAFGLFITLLLFASAKSAFAAFVLAISFGFMGGAFIVPLNANIQLFAGDKNAGKILAGSNFIQNIFMVAFLLLAILFAYLNIGTKTILYVMSLSALICAIVAFKALPNLSARMFVAPIFRLVYRVRVLGEIPQNGGMLLVGNHISWIDWALIQLVVPRKVKFVMHVSFYEKWRLKWFFDFFSVLRIGKGTNRKTILEINEALKNGEVVAIFAEGFISPNSTMSPFKSGYELAARGSGAKIVAFHIGGFWGSIFSKAHKSFKKKHFFKRKTLNIAFSEPLDENIEANEIKKEVEKLAYYNLGDYLDLQKPFQFEWLRKSKNPFHKQMVDFSGAELSNFKVLVAVLLFIDKLKFSQKHIGILLPSSNACAITNLTMLIKGKVVVNLNYTLSSLNLANCVKDAGLKQIITSKKFVKKLEARGFKFSDEIKAKFFYLEDELKVSKFDKIKAFLKALLMPKFMIEKLYFAKVKIEDEATIIYSSGSESAPKGIVLTHKNIMTNFKQVEDLLGQENITTILSSLPTFHSFGLTLTTLFPLYANFKSVYVADPTDALSVGEMVEKHKAEVMFGTSTFFRIYTKNRKATKEMFESIKFPVAGGEKLNLAVKEEFEAKFDKTLLEGYGTTETSPVVSVNLPTINSKKFSKNGSVGRALNGTIVKIVDESLNELEVGEKGLIIVGAHQVMKGYNNRQSRSIFEKDGIRYYKTGDIGYLDSEGFIFITDRISRFAKIGGEMVSLSMVEGALHEVLGEDSNIATTNLKDDKKGEKIVLLYEGEKSKDEIIEAIKESSLSPLMRPAEIYRVDKIPLLGTGKVDFRELKSLALSLSQING